MVSSGRDLYKDIEVEVEFDKMMALGGPGQEGFVETFEDVLSLGRGAHE